MKTEIHRSETSPAVSLRLDHEDPPLVKSTVAPSSSPGRNSNPKMMARESDLSFGSKTLASGPGVIGDEDDGEIHTMLREALSLREKYGPCGDHSHVFYEQRDSGTYDAHYASLRETKNREERFSDPQEGFGTPAPFRSKSQSREGLLHRQHSMDNSPVGNNLFTANSKAYTAGPPQQQQESR